jgi:hypothetical protein
METTDAETIPILNRTTEFLKRETKNVRWLQQDLSKKTGEFHDQADNVPKIFLTTSNKKSNG